MLTQFGGIESITIRAPEEGRTTTWALVTFSNQLEAKAAFDAKELPGSSFFAFPP